MSLTNFINKINSHSQEFEKKISFWKSPKKKGSKGEIYTREFLKKYGIVYKEQFTFKDLYYKNKEYLLRFDFKVWYKNTWFLLEIDGGQHNRLVNWNGKLTESEMETALKENQERDNLKNQYCKSHNIKLERIVWDGNKERLIKNLTSLFKNYFNNSFTN